MVPNQIATSAQDRFSFMLFIMFILSFLTQERCSYYTRFDCQGDREGRPYNTTLPVPQELILAKYLLDQFADI